MEASAPPIPDRARAAASGSRERCGSARACCAAPLRSSSSRSCSPTSTCARWTPTTTGRSATSTPPVGFGLAIVVAARAQRAWLLRLAASRPERTVVGRARRRGAGAALGRAAGRSSGRRSASGRPAAATPASTSAGRRSTPCSRCRCIYWIETQVATAWRRGTRACAEPSRPRGRRPHRPELLQAGLEACSFFWTFYVAIGVAAVRHPLPGLWIAVTAGRRLVDRTAAGLCGARRAALLAGRPRATAAPARSRWRDRLRSSPGWLTIVRRAGLPDRHLRRPAVLGPHAPARAAAHRGAAADPARPALAADVARAAAQHPHDDRARAGPRSLDGAAARAGAPVAGVAAVQRDVRAVAHPGRLRRDADLERVHDLEHAMFFFTGLLFWARVIDPGPLRPRLIWPARIAYVVGAMVVGWVLAITLVLVPHPLYPHYAALAHRPGGISALTDQQLAGGRDVGAGLAGLHDRDADRASTAGSSRTRAPSPRRQRSPPEEDRRPTMPLLPPTTSSPARSSRCCCRSGC